MKEYAAGIQSSELRLIDEAPAKSHATAASRAAATPVAGAKSGTESPRNGSAEASAAIAPYNADAPSKGAPAAARVKSVEASATPTIDKFLAAATKEFEAGIVDQPLWKHAVAQSGNDRTLATRNYLRARATALRVAKREKRQERRERRARALSGLGAPAETGGATMPAAHASATPTRLSVPRKRIQVVAIGAALIVFFVVAFFLVVRSESDASWRNENVARTAAPAAAAGKPARLAVAAPVNADARRGAAAQEDWAGKLEKLKAEGNWNVVVLYAGEWTRAQPDDALAWKELAAGYSRLRQDRDALDAANKVVQLVPEDATAWARLGQINLALRQPADALAAFEQAVARDDHDSGSIVQVGTLATQLGRLADARAAFDKALALNPLDVDALCGSASLAQKEQRPKDAEAFTRQVAAQSGRCRDPAEGESVRVAVGGKVSPASPR